MIEFDAKLYPSGRAQSLAVRVRIEASGRLSHNGPNTIPAVDFAKVHISERLGRAPRFLTLPDGSRLEVKDNDSIDQAIERHAHHQHRQLWLFRVERTPLLILALLLVVVVAGWGTYRHGIPAFAKATAPLVPDAARVASSQHTLSFMERTVLQPSSLDEALLNERLAAYEQRLQPYVALSSINIRFYNSPRMGANAFALPDGTLVFTDALMNILDEDEFLAVAAHEIGHVLHDHGMRNVISSTALIAAITLLTSGADAFSEIVAGTPLALAQLAYTRDLEREADDVAMDLMQASGIPPAAFAQALTKLVRSYGGDPDDSSTWEGYLSTHPAPAERIERFR